MHQLKALIVLLLITLVLGCSGVEVVTTPPDEFAARHFTTYSWRTEPFQNLSFSNDAIYVVDPILRKIVNAKLQEKGYTLVAGGGEFTIDYMYAPGLRMGATSETASFISPRAGVRPNSGVSQAERDNAIALGGVKETRNVTLQINAGSSGVQIWSATITKFVADVNETSKSRTREALESGVSTAFANLPRAG